MMPLWTTTIRPGSPGAGGRSPRWGGRGWPSGCGRRPNVAGERLRGEARREVAELARGAPALEHAVRHHGDARRVVAAVLEPPQAVEDDRDGVPPAHVADDAAHGPSPRSRPPTGGRASRYEPVGRSSRRSRRPGARAGAAAQPGFVTWRARPRASASFGTSSVIVLPAAT